MNSNASKNTKGIIAGAGRWLLALAIIGIAVGVYVLRPAAREDSRVTSSQPTPRRRRRRQRMRARRTPPSPCRACSIWAPTSASRAR